MQATMADIDYVVSGMLDSESVASILSNYGYLRNIIPDEHTWLFAGTQWVNADENDQETAIEHVTNKFMLRVMKRRARRIRDFEASDLASVALSTNGKALVDVFPLRDHVEIESVPHEWRDANEWIRVYMEYEE